MSASPPSRRHIALLRGINVGKAKRIAMADLRALLESLGYREVRTLLNSGNVVFDLPANPKGDPAARIEQALAQTLGVSSRVTVITAKELAVIVKENPLGKIAADPSRYLVAFVTQRADLARLAPLQKENWSPDALAVGTGAAYLWCPEGILASKLATAAGRLLGAAATTRNWATVLKLQTLAALGSERREG